MPNMFVKVNETTIVNFMIHSKRRFKVNVLFFSVKNLACMTHLSRYFSNHLKTGYHALFHNNFNFENFLKNSSLSFLSTSIFLLQTV